MGLASEALPREQVLPRALERAKDIAANTAPVSVAIAKRLLWEGLTASVPQMREREGKLFTWAGNQPDSKEGVMSFLEKRMPAWKLSVAKDTPRDLLQREGAMLGRGVQ
jgi:enoyl-CoA hydratase/carnithine racemase